MNKTTFVSNDDSLDAPEVDLQQTFHLRKIMNKLFEPFLFYPNANVQVFLLIFLILHILIGCLRMNVMLCTQPHNLRNPSVISLWVASGDCRLHFRLRESSHPQNHFVHQHGQSLQMVAASGLRRLIDGTGFTRGVLYINGISYDVV